MNLRLKIARFLDAIAWQIMRLSNRIRFRAIRDYME